MGDVANNTVALLGETGKIAVSHNFEDAALNAELLLQEIGTGAVKKILKKLLTPAFDLLRISEKLQIARCFKELYSKQLIH